MRNGFMFGTLRRYREAASPFRLSFSGEESRRKFLEICVNRSVPDTGAEVSAEDEVLTLSTCTGMGYAARRVVQAVLREDGQQKRPSVFGALPKADGHFLLAYALQIAGRTGINRSTNPLEARVFPQFREKPLGRICRRNGFPAGGRSRILRSMP